MPAQLVRLPELRKPLEPDDELSASNVTNIDTNAVDFDEYFNAVLTQINNIINGADAGTGGWKSDIETVFGSDASLKVLYNRATLEAKLADVFKPNLNDMTPPAAAYATETLTCTVNPGNTETVTIDSKTYTFQTSLTDVDGNVQIGVDLAASMDNLRAAINLDAGAGTAYAASMTLHPTVSATDTDTTVVATAKAAGTVGNSIAISETLANGAWGGGAINLSGGAGDVIALTGLYKPDKNIAIATTNKGGVAAQLSGAIGAHALDEIGSGNPLRPENLVALFDGSTGDPILDGDKRRIFGLLQVGSAATDGNAFGDAGNDQGQLSFVVANSTYDDLEAADAVYTGGVTMVYDYTWRESVSDLPAVYWRADIAGADPLGATAHSLDSAYDGGNFITVDSANVDLRLADSKGFDIRKGSGGALLFSVDRDDGGTDKVQVHSAVDEFDVDAATSSFAQGISVDDTDQTINIGKTAVGVLDSATAELRATTGAAKVAATGTLQDVELSATQDITFQTAQETTAIPLDDAAAGPISGLTGGPYASISAAIKAGIEGGGIDFTLDQYDAVANFAKEANVPGVTLDLTTFSGDWNTIANVNLILIHNGLWRRGGNSTPGQENDWYPGDTPASGDVKFMARQGIKIGDVILTVAWS